MLREYGLEESGFKMSAHPDDASPVVTDYFTPNGIDSTIVRNYYLEKHNTMVGYGFAHVDEKTGTNRSFRIAHFGLAAENERIDHMIDITKQFVAENM